MMVDISIYCILYALYFKNTPTQFLQAGRQGREQMLDVTHS